MTVDEYKHRTIELSFPSGLVLRIQPPKVKALMDIAISGDDAIKVQALMLQELSKGFPDNFALDDITDPEDWAYLQEWLGGFFQRMASQPTSKPSCAIVTLPPDSGHTTS